MASNIAAAITTALLARHLSTHDYGAFTLAKAVLMLLASVFEFGVFLPAARLIALAPNDLDRRAWVGATLVAYVPVGLLFVAGIAAGSQVVDDVFWVDTGDALLVTAPLGLAYPFGVVALAISQGLQRGPLQPLMAALASAIFLAGVVAVGTLGRFPDLAATLAIRGVAFMFAALVFVRLVHPVVSEVRRRLTAIWVETRRWGMKAYAGRVISVGTYNMDTLMVGALADARQLGSYGLASSLAALIMLPASGVANALFRRMTVTRVLDRRILAVVAIWGICATAGGAAVSHVLITRYLNPDLALAAWLLLPLGLAATARSVTTILNTYLNARAAGRELRNTSIILFVVNIVANFALIPPFGATGAAFASLLAMLCNLGGYVYYTLRLPPAADSAS